MKKQLGRSMIEMLGVLAIIGVLSIGGIALYRRAVNHHQANSILDDANRFAFVITERGGFPANAFIDNVQYERTSTYNLDAFVGAAGGQFGIVVTDVPKGVCEPLVDKAHIDYKVRVLSANTAESIEQLSASGLIYDSFNKDICTNDPNDIVLYFGDTSGQCNKPKEGEDYTPCNTNADCCGGYFCAFENPTYCYERTKGNGKCKKISTIPYDTIVTDSGEWIAATTTMTYWSAKNWCMAQGKRQTSLADLGCGNGNIDSGYCTNTGGFIGWNNSSYFTGKDGSILRTLQESGWYDRQYYWLIEWDNDCNAGLIFFENSYIINAWKNDARYAALCH